MLQVKDRILYRNIMGHIGENGLNVNGLGSVPIVELINKGRLTKVYEIYNLRQSDFKDLGYGKEQCESIIRNIRANKECTVPRFLMSLNIKGMTLRLANEIADLLGEDWRMVFTNINKDELGFIPKECADDIEYLYEIRSSYGLFELIETMKPDAKHKAADLKKTYKLYFLDKKTSDDIRIKARLNGYTELYSPSNKIRYVIVPNESVAKQYSTRYGNTLNANAAILYPNEFINLFIK